MSSSRYLTLDWRSCPSTTEIITRLEKFLGTMDAQGQAGVVNSRAKASVLVEDGGVRMMLRPANAFSVYKSGKLHFWHRMFRIAETLGNLMGNSDEPMDRFLQYREFGVPSCSMRQVKNTVEDLALSIGVHPWAFGVRPEGTGHLVLPPGILIDAVVVENMFAFRNKSGVATKAYTWHSGHGSFTTIPAFVLRIKVRVTPNAASGIRAVVVVEHRNLKTLMAKTEAIPGAILVMTSGSAACATTELLHMLDTALPNVPFLYIGDHDFPGFQIYSNIKYGSNDKSYCSHISVCPRLQWVGPSKADLVASPAGYKGEKRELHRVHHPHQSETEVTRILDAWEQAHSKRIQAKLSVADDRDRALVRGWERKGWLEYEPDVDAAVDDMLAGPSKFRLADMAVVGVPYLKLFIKQQVQIAAPVRVILPIIEAASMRSPVGQRFALLPSQTQTSPVKLASEANTEESVVDPMNESSIDAQLAGLLDSVM